MNGSSPADVGRKTGRVPEGEHDVSRRVPAPKKPAAIDRHDVDLARCEAVVHAVSKGSAAHLPIHSN
jgi:hypothetical protein